MPKRENIPNSSSSQDRQERVYEPLENEIMLDTVPVMIDTLRRQPLTATQRKKFEKISVELSRFVDEVLGMEK